MNELNCGQEEQYAGPEKKKSTSKIVKRTLVVAALALAVYVVYSVVYLFVSPDRNIQQIYLVPEDAAFIIQSSAPIEDWEKFSGSETWQCLKKAKSFEEVTESVEKLDSVVKSNIENIPCFGITHFKDINAVMHPVGDSKATHDQYGFHLIFQ